MISDDAIFAASHFFRSLFSFTAATLWPAIRAEQIRRKQAAALAPIHTLRSQGQSNKFLTTQRSFDTDDDKDAIANKLFNASNVELEVLDHHQHQTVPTLSKRGLDGHVDARSRSTTAESKEVGESVASVRVGAPHNALFDTLRM